MAETLKEYLVKLGWDINKAQLSQVQNSLSSFNNSSNGLLKTLSKSFVKAGVSVAGFLGSSIAGITKMMFGIADADREVERFARRMWTTEENARSLTTALDAVGASFDEIFYMTPEEYRNLMELRNLGKSLEAPAELQGQLRQIRDINQEIDKLKVTLSYGTQWIAYYFLKIVGQDVDNVQDALEKLNAYLQKNLPQIAEKVAKVLGYVVRLGKTGVEAFQRLTDVVGRLWDSMDSGTKVATSAVTGFLALMKLGPVGMFIAAILALLLLLDDIFTWQRGGNSLFGEQYEQFSEWWNSLDTSQFSDLGGDVNELLDSCWELVKVVGEALKAFGEWAVESGVLKGTLELLLGVINGIVEALTWIVDLILTITGNIDKTSEDSWFRKVLGYGQKEEISGWKKLANVGMGALDVFPWLWNTTIGRIEGVPQAQTFSDFFGYDYGGSVSSEDAFTASSGGGRSGAGVTNQTNNTTYNNTFDIDGADSPSQTASEIARTLYRQRANIDPIK